LSRSFKSVDSIQNYVSGIRTLHLLVGKPFPDLNEFCIHLLYRGIARQKRHIPKRALPITIDILLKIYNHIDLSDVKHATIWCLFLFAFFLMARKSNLVPDSVHKFDSSKQLTREKIVLNGDIVIVKFEWSKTIQFGKRVIQIPLVSIPGSPLCPVTAFKHMCEMLPASEHSPAFLFPKGSGVVPVTY